MRTQRRAYSKRFSRSDTKRQGAYYANVDYLSDKDLLVRKQDCNDRRCQILEVTEKAKNLVPKIKEGIIKTDELLFHNFSEKEKEDFKMGMSKLFATINTLPEPAFIVQAFKKK